MKPYCEKQPFLSVFWSFQIASQIYAAIKITSAAKGRNGQTANEVR